MYPAQFFYILERSFTCPSCKQRDAQFFGASMVQQNPQLVAKAAEGRPITNCGKCGAVLPAGIAVIGEVRQIDKGRYLSVKFPHQVHIDN
jgi:transcription elongation factor Elf1